MTTVLHLRSVVKGREGEWYRKTLEYGFWVKLDTQCYLDHRYAAPRFAAAEIEERSENDLYACGWLSPRHPLPVIQMRHPHEGRMAEVYRKGEERLIFVRYTADPPPNATWDNSIQGWVLNTEATGETAHGH